VFSAGTCLVERFDNWGLRSSLSTFRELDLLLDYRTAAYLPQKGRRSFGSIYKPIISWLALFWEKRGDRSLSLRAIYDWFKVLVLYFFLSPVLHLQHEKKHGNMITMLGLRRSDANNSEHETRRGWRKIQVKGIS